MGTIFFSATLHYDCYVTVCTRERMSMTAVRLSCTNKIKWHVRCSTHINARANSRTDNTMAFGENMSSRFFFVSSHSFGCFDNLFIYIFTAAAIATVATVAGAVIIHNNCRRIIFGTHIARITCLAGRMLLVQCANRPGCTLQARGASKAKN